MTGAAVDAKSTGGRRGTVGAVVVMEEDIMTGAMDGAVVMEAGGTTGGPVACC